MTDLDKRVAEARGWREELSPIGVGDRRIWVDGTGQQRNHVAGYRPSTDLNQAVAFAEWVAKQKNVSFQIDYWPDVGDEGNYRVHSDGHTRYLEPVASALCEIMLKVLE